MKTQNILNNETSRVVPSFNGKYPLHELSPRRFEELLYSIVCHAERTGLDQQLPKITRAEIMQGVGERGRDLNLYNGTEVVGVIQCKHSKRSEYRLTKPEIFKEVLKFFLHVYVDNQLIPDKEKFTYVLATNVDLSEPAKIFLMNISEEVTSSHQKCIDVMNKLVSSTKAFNNICVDHALVSWVAGLANNITFSRLIGADINSQIARHVVVK